jgi:hypothetical protein
MTDTDIGAATTRLAAAAEALEQTIARISASHDALHAKIDRIIAAIDERALTASADKAEPTQRKTLAPFVSMLLSKSGADDTSIAADSAVLDKALASLSLEQRVAVKAEMARAGLIA